MLEKIVQHNDRKMPLILCVMHIRSTGGYIYRHSEGEETTMRQVIVIITSTSSREDKVSRDPTVEVSLTGMIQRLASRERFDED